MSIIKSIFDDIGRPILDPVTGHIVSRRSSNIKYGLLYNWFALVESTGLAPEGWHIPSATELAQFVGDVGPPAPSAYAGRIKEMGTEYWNSPNTGAEDILDFSFRGSGWCQQSGFGPTYEGGLKEQGWMYSSTYDGSAGGAFAIGFSYNSAGYVTGRLAGVVYTSDAYSVRCIRNSMDGWVEGEQVTDYDGNIYDTVRVGSTVWLKQNLAVAHFNDGSPIPEATILDWLGAPGCWCRAYNNDWDNVFL